MTFKDILLNPAEAARQLGISAKALRLYEQHGLLQVRRNAAGWRFYDPQDMVRAEEIVALRQLGLSLKQIGSLSEDDALDGLLARQAETLGREMAELGQRLERVRQMRAALARGDAGAAEAMAFLTRGIDPDLSLELPWPWASERFEVARLPPVSWLTGPLGSGKTRLAMAIATAIDGAVFCDLERSGNPAPCKDATDPKQEAAIEWLVGDGATASKALIDLVAQLLNPDANAVVVDLVEAELDAPTQFALGAWLRRYDDAGRPLIIMTRSEAVLDLDSLGVSDLVIYCPPNHAPPLKVVPVKGAAGYEAIAACLGSPEARARTAGMRAVLG